MPLDIPFPLEPPPALKARFLARLADRLVRFRALCENLTDPAREEMRQLAHALAGTSGTFGYPRVGDCARLETLLMEVSDPRRLADAVQDLLREGEEARREGPGEPAPEPQKS